MSEERKDLDRRSFLKGAATAVGAAAGAGLGMTAASAKDEAPPSKFYGMAKGDEKNSEDDLKELEPLYQAACEEAKETANRIVEKAVKDGGKGSLRTRSLLQQQGLRVRSSSALKLAKDIPSSALLARKAEEAKREGWHIHGSVKVFWWYVHGHVSW